MFPKSLFSGVVLALSLTPAVAGSDQSMPPYAHIFVIIEENHTTDEIIGNPAAPTFTRLARTYGFASNFYAIRHPSEPNYISLVGGDTFGIADDDAVYCVPHLKHWGCEKSDRTGYVDHTITAPNLASQLDSAGLSWKGYFEDLPEPGALIYRWPSDLKPVRGKPEGLYGAKHNGFVSFKSVQDDPKRSEKIVGFDVLARDIKAGTLPRFAHIVPNQCNDMHGLHGHDVPVDCAGKNSPGLVRRADRMLDRIVGSIMNSRLWKSADNSAIVVTFDENDDDKPSTHANGCCGSTSDDPTNPGGGWIPTIVITNHGPRHFTDPAPYNHFSLLRTIEDAFGLPAHLGHAADDNKGVVSMTPLFAVRR